MLDYLFGPGVVCPWRKRLILKLYFACCSMSTKIRGRKKKLISCGFSQKYPWRQCVTVKTLTGVQELMLMAQKEWTEPNGGYLNRPYFIHSIWGHTVLTAKGSFCLRSALMNECRVNVLSNSELSSMSKLSHPHCFPATSNIARISCRAWGLSEWPGPGRGRVRGSAVSWAAAPRKACRRLMLTAGQEILIPTATHLEGGWENSWLPLDTVRAQQAGPALFCGRMAK